MSNELDMNYKYEKEKLNQLSRGLLNIVKKYNCYIAGGAVTSVFTGREINDIDIYFKNKTDLYNLLVNENMYILHTTDKSITFSYRDIQCQAIFFDYFEKASDIFDRFDFTVCMGAYDCTEDKFVLHKDFIRHNSQRRLIFNENTDYPIISCLRVDKYKSKGYEIGKMEFIKMMLCVNKLNIKTFSDFKKHVGGMYGESYNKAFDEIEQDSFDIGVAIEKLNNLIYTTENNPTAVDFKGLSKEEFLRLILSFDKKHIFKFKNEYFDDEFLEVRLDEDNESLYEIKPIQEVIKPPYIFYKIVKKREDRYFSRHDRDFEYKLNNYVEPSNKSDSNSGIYCCFNELNSYYSNEVVLSLRIDDLSDIKDIRYGNILLNKCFVLNEISNDKNTKNSGQ